ncbi:MAG TPA: hypothetical protein VF925_14935 [Casimicrobiaceae bacterium]
MKRALRIVAQAMLYAAFVAVIGYFSTSPAYVHLAPGESVVKLSLSHAGERKEACRTRTDEELAKLAPNMRSPTVCPRERVPVRVVVAIDGATLFDVVAPPTGLAKDGASNVYRSIAIAAGRHHVHAELADAPGGRVTFTANADVDLAPGRLLVIDFSPADGGFLFRS